VNFGLQTLVKTRVRSGQKKWPEIVILTILSPVRLPFRHTGLTRQR
jgi:anti-anti-sigma regulatory factor